MFVYDYQQNAKMCYLKNTMAGKLTKEKGKSAGPKFCPIYDEGNIFKDYSRLSMI